MSRLCSWCLAEYTQHHSYPQERGAVYRAMQSLGLVHVSIGRGEGTCGICGAPARVIILDVPNPAHPRTVVQAHKGPGCVGPWVHNKALAEHEGLAALPLPCFDQYCNAAWGTKA